MQYGYCSDVALKYHVAVHASMQQRGIISRLRCYK